MMVRFVSSNARTLPANAAMTSLTAHTVPTAAVRIVKEGEAFLRVWIDTDGFTLHVMAFKVRHCRIDVINAKAR